MRSKSKEINVFNFTVPMKNFCDSNGFDYEYYAAKDCITIWVHNDQYFQNFRNFNKNVYLYIALFSGFLNRFRNNDDLELYEEDLEGDIIFGSKKYKMKKFSEVPGLIIANLKRIDEIEEAA